MIYVMIFNLGHYVNVNIRKLGLIVRNMFDSNMLVISFERTFQSPLTKNYLKHFMKNKKIYFYQRN